MIWVNVEVPSHNQDQSPFYVTNHGIAVMKKMTSGKIIMIGILCRPILASSYFFNVMPWSDLKIWYRSFLVAAYLIISNLYWTAVFVNITWTECDKIVKWHCADTLEVKVDLCFSYKFSNHHAWFVHRRLIRVTLDKLLWMHHWCPF